MAYWKHYETCFRRAQSILEIPDDQDFSEAFEFEAAASHDDARPLGDTITEVLFAIDLADAGFTGLRKLRRLRKRKRSDFTGRHGGKGFAIEIKAIHDDGSGMVPIVEMAPGSMRVGELRTHVKKLIRKIGDKDAKAIAQLTATKEEFDLDETMLAIQSDYIGTSAAIDGALTPEEASAVVTAARQIYPEVGFIAFKWMVNRPTPIIIEPGLSGHCPQ